jgi:RimJ/RimL family protein N-acetyltransferase
MRGARFGRARHDRGPDRRDGSVRQTSRALALGGEGQVDVTIVPMDELTTARLRLRSWSYEDADFLFDMYRRWEVQRFIGLEPRVMADRTEAVASIERRRALNDPVHGIWAIERLTDQVLVGNLLLKPIPVSGGQALLPADDVEIGWHLHPDHWGHGYATEAGAAVLARAHAAGLSRVIAVTAPENFASQAVCRRLGMRYLGQTRAYYDTTCELFEAERAS